MLLPWNSVPHWTWSLLGGYGLYRCAWLFMWVLEIWTQVPMLAVGCSDPLAQLPSPILLLFTIDQILFFTCLAIWCKKKHFSCFPAYIVDFCFSSSLFYFPMFWIFSSWHFPACIHCLSLTFFYEIPPHIHCYGLLTRGNHSDTVYSPLEVFIPASGDYT